jgi:hypothetical protein
MTAVVGVADEEAGGRPCEGKKGASLGRELKAGPDKRTRGTEKVSVVLVFRNGFSIELVSSNLIGFLANSCY